MADIYFFVLFLCFYAFLNSSFVEAIKDNKDGDYDEPKVHLLFIALNLAFLLGFLAWLIFYSDWLDLGLGLDKIKL